MSRTNPMFAASDGTQLEILMHAPTKPRACILVWPCFGGNVRTYCFPIQTFIENGYSAVLYNPRGQGKSGDQTTLKLAIEDLLEFIYDRHLEKLPLIAVGHSMGATGLLMISRALTNIDRYFFIAPGFDPRDAIYHMYRKGTIHGFVKMLSSHTTDDHLIREIMTDSTWMDPVYWQSNRLRQRLDELPGRISIGRLLEDHFFTDSNCYEDLGLQRSKTQIILPCNDDWQSMDVTMRLARKYSIPVNRMKSAKEHLFLDAWPDVWDYISKETCQRCH
jgi:pimeloyl-ACP methyl ester carboxylesterase